MKQKRTLKIDSFSHVEVECRHINSDRLCEDSITYISETLNNTFFHDLSDEDDREGIINHLEYYCSMLVDNGSIDQFDIVFDKRNNKRRWMDQGLYFLELRYKQTHCLNDSSIKFKIGHNGKKN